MDTTEWIAVYAAIVATGALALEVRRWFESGPRISLRIQPDMITVGAGLNSSDSFVVATVRNRGSAPTTLTNLAMVKYESRFYRWTRKRGQHYVVPKPDFPGSATTIPYVLEPGTQWQGFIRRNGQLFEHFEDGTVVIEVYCSDRDKPYRKRIARKKKAASKIIEN
ncbi:hypothetical protein [Celeribacter sp.]|uniref:hypothetical protein n=1 Tax=Celeribacter sp. TaxID=1890673 RepID=UPI003A8D5A5C